MQTSNHCQHCGNKHPGQVCATNPTLIQWKYGGTQVYVYGSWSHYQIGTKLQKSREPPYFHAVPLILTVGTHYYKFYVDGQWKHDGAEKAVPDNFGGFNNQVSVFPKSQIQTESDDQEPEEDPVPMDFKHASQVLTTTLRKNTIRVKIKTTMDGSDIHVRGSWDNWLRPIPLKRRYLSYAESFENYCHIQVIPAQYEYKFVISNQWLNDSSLPSIQNSEGSFNNVINIKRKNLVMPKKANLSTVYWSQKKLMNLKFERISGHSLTRIGNYFYVFGGQVTGTFSDKLYKLNTKSNQLDIVDNTVGETPDNRAYHSAIAYGSKIIFFGGLNWHQVFDQYFVLNTNTMEWAYTKLNGDSPQTRERATLTLLSKEDILIYFGGYYCTPDLEVEQVFNDVHCLNLKSLSWNKPLFQSEKPAPRYAHTATQIQEKMYVFGGHNTSQNFVNKYPFVVKPSQNFNDVWMLDFTQGKANWVDLSSKISGQPPSPRHGHTACPLHKHIIIFGGRGNTSKELFNDIFILDVQNLEWSKPQVKGTGPSPRYYHTAGLFDDAMWVLGGNTGMWRNEHVYRMSFTEKDEESGEPSSPDRKFGQQDYFVPDDEDEVDMSSDEEFQSKLRKIKITMLEESKS